MHHLNSDSGSKLSSCDPVLLMWTRPQDDEILQPAFCIIKMDLKKKKSFLQIHIFVHYPNSTAQ